MSEIAIKEDSSMKLIEILEFQLDSNDSHFAIYVSDIIEILKHTPVTTLPNAHEYFEGVFLYRGEVVPVIDLHKVISAGKSDENGHLIITNINDKKVAFHVDTVLGIHRIPDKDFLEYNKEKDSNANKITSHLVKFDDRLVVVLDCQDILKRIDL